MPTKRDVTIAWNIWHITRIEDITMNLLVGNCDQVLDEAWLKKLNIGVKDTGNAMSDEEILSLSKELCKEALREYRLAVFHRSLELLETLGETDMRRKFRPEQVERILLEGCLTQAPQSVWLADFWGKKTVAGILLLPLTRHGAGHLNDCLKLRKKCEKLLSNAQQGGIK